MGEFESRDYGVDMLRLISMIMVITLHVLDGGGVLNMVKNGLPKMGR